MHFRLFSNSFYLFFFLEQFDYDTFTCNSGISGQVLQIFPNPGLTLNWTFPQLRRVGGIHVNLDSRDPLMPIVLDVSFPVLTFSANYVILNAAYYTNISTALFPVLATVVRVFYLLLCPLKRLPHAPPTKMQGTYLDILANYGALIGYVSIAGSAAAGLRVTVRQPVSCVPF